MSVPLRLRIVRVIALKELLESLRDRRTLFMMIFVPMLLYPVLLLVITQVASIQQERLEAQTSRVAVQVAEPAVLSAAQRDDLARLVTFLDQDEGLEIVRLEVPRTEGAARARIIVADDESGEAGESYDAIVTWIPPPVDAADTELATARIELDFESVEDRSRKAVDRLEARLDAWSKSEVARRLEARGLPASLAEPVTYARNDLSDSAQRGGFFLGAILPMLVVITVLLGAFYPAIDLTAGEKERSSIQTLFAAPISVLEVVAGKYLAVVCIALISGTANLVSLGLMFGYVGTSMLGGTGANVDLGLTPQVVAVLFVIIVLIAIFFAALVLAVAVLARDFKDGQNLLTPVFMLAMIPGMIAQMPGFELTVPLTMVPGVNVILLMKQVLVDGVNLQLLFMVAAASVVSTALALVVAAHFFGQERVMVGDRGSFDLLARPSQIVPRERPSVSEGLAWFCVAFLLLFYVGTWAQGRDLMLGLLATLWLCLLLPTLGVARYLKLDLRATFNLRRPAPRVMLAAAIMGPTAWIVVDTLNRVVDVVLPVPPEFVEGMQQAFAAPDSPMGWAWFLFIVAVTPGICEEMLFRGFIFSSLRGRVKPWTVILASSVMFGLLHLSIYRLFGTTVLGIVMGILVYQSRSIFPAMLFHTLNNATALLAAHFLLTDVERPPVWLIAVGFVATLAGLALVRRPVEAQGAAGSGSG